MIEEMLSLIDWLGDADCVLLLYSFLYLFLLLGSMYTPSVHWQALALLSVLLFSLSITLSVSYHKITLKFWCISDEQRH